MFAKKLLLSFTAIFVVFTEDIIAYNHAEDLPKAPGSSDISGLSIGSTYATTKSSRDPWNSGYMPFVHPDFTQEFSSSQAQPPPSELKDPVFKPVGLGLNGWGRIPRVPKFSHRASPHLQIPAIRPSRPSEVEDPVFKPVGLGLNGWGRIPRVPKFSHRASPHLQHSPIRHPRPLEVEDPLFKPVGLGLNGWGRVPRVPKFSQLWGSPPSPPLVWTPNLAVDPPFKPPSPTPTADPSFKATTSVTEPISLNPAKSPSPANDMLDGGIPPLFGPQQ